MAITAQHLIADLRNIASSGGNPNEFKISDRQILYWIEQTRSILISQALSKKDDINDSWIQFITCVEMEQVEDTDCCLVDSNCFLLKSVQQIPSTIDSWRDNTIISITTAGGEPISKSNHIKQRYQKYNKYTSKSWGWYLKDDYLYVINNQNLNYLTVAGIFEFPSDLGEFVSCDNQECWTLDSNYPVSLTLATQITDIVVKTKVNTFLTLPMDNSNDANGATPQQTLQNKQANTNSNQ